MRDGRRGYYGTEYYRTEYYLRVWRRASPQPEAMQDIPDTFPALIWIPVRGLKGSSIHEIGPIPISVQLHHQE